VTDVIGTVVVGTVLALLCMYLILSCAASGWGDRLPQESTSVIRAATRGQRRRCVSRDLAAALRESSR